MKKKIINAVLTTFSVSVLVLAFQNCARAKFSSLALDRSVANLGAGTAVPLDPDLAVPLDPSDPLTCVFNGSTYTEGQSVLAFQNSSVTFGQVCVSELRQCNSGILSGSYSFAACASGTPKSCLFDGRTIEHGNSVEAAQNPTVSLGNSCVFENRVCNDGMLSGSYAYSLCSPQTAMACLFDGRTISHAASVAGFLTSTVPFGAACVAESRICNNGLLSGSYTFGSCNPGAPSSCLFDGKTLAHGERVISFESSTKNFGETCASEERTCNNGILSGSFAFPACGVGAAKACTFNGATLNHGASVVAFQAGNAAFNENCVAESRLCTNGILSGSFTFGSCAIAKPLSCLFNGVTVPHGSDIPSYETSSVPFGQQCISEKKVCNNGILSGDFSQLSCAVTPAASCTLNGKKIDHASTATAYSAATVPFGNQCVSESRLCTNGSLSGSFTSDSCSVSAPQACLFNGESILHGTSVTGFAKNAVGFNDVCQSQNRTCNNGVLSGTFSNSICSVAPAGNCSLNGISIAHGAAKSFSAAPSVPFGQACATQARTCTNGSLSGSYTFESCSVAAPLACSFNGVVVPHGAGITGYAAAAVAYNQSCQAEARYCNNGFLSGSYTVSSCAQNAPRACSFQGGTGQYEWLSAGTDESSGSYLSEVLTTYTLQHGESRAFFATSFLSFGNGRGGISSWQCPVSPAGNRTCIDGALSGNPAYDKTTCVYKLNEPPSPLMIHFNSDVEKAEPLVFGSQKNGVNFDILGINSYPEAFSKKRISWYKSKQYYWVTLPNAKGEVNGINELFGNNTYGRDNKFAADGYKALAKYDGKSLDGKKSAGKSDNLITKADPVFQKLRLWADRNHDGLAQKSELVSLDSMSVEAIDLNADANYKETDKYGNDTTLKSVVKTTDGRYHLIFDMWFKYQEPK